MVLNLLLKAGGLFSDKAIKFPIYSKFFSLAEPVVGGISISIAPLHLQIRV
jgi:hypothetical protein